MATSDLDSNTGHVNNNSRHGNTRNGPGLEEGECNNSGTEQMDMTNTEKGSVDTTDSYSSSEKEAEAEDIDPNDPWLTRRKKSKKTSSLRFRKY